MMNKTFIRTITNKWDNEHQKAHMQAKLNANGFYVLCGIGDSLDVYALEYKEPFDVRIFKSIVNYLKDYLRKKK